MIAKDLFRNAMAASNNPAGMAFVGHRLDLGAR